MKPEMRNDSLNRKQDKCPPTCTQRQRFLGLSGITLNFRQKKSLTKQGEISVVL